MADAGRDRLIDELRQAQCRLRADLDAMTRLHELGSLFVREGNLEPVLVQIVDAAIAISGADFGNIQLLDAESGDLKIVAQRGLPDWWLEFWNTVSNGQGVCGTALERGGRVIVEDVERSPIFEGTPALEIQRRVGVRAVQSTPLMSRSGKPLGMFSTHWRKPGRPDERCLRLLDLLGRHAADITERAHNEQALRRSEERFRLLVEGANDCAIYMLAPDGTVTSWTAAAEQIYGYSEEEIVGQDREIFFIEEDRRAEVPRRELKEAAANGRCEHEAWRIRKDGSRFWADVLITALRDDRGNLRGFASVHRDFTDRKNAEMALREQERRYRWLFEKSLDAVYVTRHSDGSILDANPAACALHGMSVDEIRARGRAGLVVVDDRLADGMVQRAIHGEGRTELNLYRKDGSIFPAEVESIIVGPERSDFTAFVIARDITERKRAEAMLRGTLQRFYSVLSSMDNPVLLVTNEGRIEFVNAALCRAFGLKESPDELVGQTAFEIVRAEGRFTRRDEQLARIQEIIGQGEPVKGEEVVFADGRTFLRDCVPLHIDGEARGRLWLHFDITERKRAEEALREEDRRKAEFLAVLSHELRNPLAPIRNSIFLLERSEPGSKQATHAKEVIRRQTEHLTRLIDDLLDVTRISRGKIVLKRTRVDLRDIIRRTTDDLRSVFAKARVELHVDDMFGPAWITADPTRITQVLGNLLQNAVKFTPAGGSVTVAAAAKDGRAEIRVRDTGVGMEPEKIQHMFAPFVQAEMTLARTNGGLGLGLALVKGLVELHGGTVEARSGGIGRGSEFLVRLPLAESEAAKVGEPQAGLGAGSREILVIEDNLDAGETLAEILELQGHHVRVARDGRSGIELAHERRPDVVLCDIGLPDIDGYEVARSLRRDEELRATRLVALSGYAQPEDQQRAREAGFEAHMSKPPDLDELMSLIAKDG